MPSRYRGAATSGCGDIWLAPFGHPSRAHGYPVSVRLAVLGPVTVEVDGRVLTLSASRERAVLGMLGLRAGRPVSVEQLIDALWGEEPPPNARKAVQTYVARVRKNLTPGAIESRGDSYLLALDENEVDAYRFVSLAGEGRTELASGGQARAATMLEEALKLWRGPALPEVEDGWVEGERVSLEELRRVVEEDLVDAKLQLGEHATVVADAERGVAAEPLRERRWGQLMLALYRSGRQADALRAYQRCRDVLIDQLGVEPGVDLRELEQAILDQSPTLSAPSGLSPWRTLLPTGLPTALAEAAERPFVGRVELLAELQATWERVCSGGRGTVLLCGEPGAGKTRLAAAVAENALRSGGAVLCGRSHPELALPFQPFAEALDPLARDAQPGSAGAIVAGLSAGFDTSEPFTAPSGNLPDGQALSQYRVFEAVARLLAGAAGSQPLVLVVEDLHWASTPTLRLLRYLASAPELRGVMLLGTLRDTEGPALAALADMAGTRRLSVGPISTDDVAVLAAGRGVVDSEVVATLHELAGGNPFLVDQLLLDLEAGELFSDSAAPRRGADVVTGRLTRLSAEARSVLELAAVAGDEFELSVLAAAHQAGQEGTLDALEEAETAGLVVASPSSKGRFRFRHAVVRLALTSGLPETRRMRFHRALAETLEQAASEPAHLGMLARHCAEAAPLGLGERAVEYARRAGELSRANFAFEEAAEYFDVALQATRFLDGHDLGLRCDILTAKAEALRRGGDASADIVLREAGALARRLDDPIRLAHVALSFTGTVAQVYDNSGVEPESVRIASDAEASLGGEQAALRARLLATMAMQVAYSDNTGTRRAPLLDESLRVARESGDARVLADVLASHQLAWIDAADLEGRIRVGQEAADVADSLRDAEIGYRAHHFLSLAQVESGDLDAYTRTRARVRELVGSLHQPGFEAELLFNDASDRFMAGDLAGAERLVHEAIAVGERGGLPDRTLAALPAACLGMPYWVAGRLAELRDVYETMARVNRRSPWAYASAWAAHEVGDDERARWWFEELAAHDFEDVPKRLVRTMMLAMMAYVATEFDDVPRAKLLLEHMKPLEGRVIAPEPVRWDLADRNLGRLYMTIGEYEVAKDYLGRATDQSRRLGAPFFLAWTLADLARLMTLTGDADKARQHADAAIATAEPLGGHAIVAAAKRAVAGT